MKKTFFVALTFYCLTAFSQNGASIEFKITSQGATGSCLVHVSDFGSKTEFKMSVPNMMDGGIHVISLVKKANPDTVYSINEEAKTYSASKKSDLDQEDNSEYTVKKIGQEKMNGYNCIHALVTSGNQITDMWTTRDIAEYSKYTTAFSSNKKIGSQKRENALKDAGCEGMPVKIIGRGEQRGGDVTMELVKFDKKTYAKSDFEIPTGYTKSGKRSAGSFQVKTQQEIMSMSAEERIKYMEDMKKQYGK